MGPIRRTLRPAVVNPRQMVYNASIVDVSNPEIADGPSRRPFVGGRAVRLARMVEATLASYLLGYLLTAVGVLVGCAAQAVGAKAVILKGTVLWANLQFWLVGRRLHVYGREHLAREVSYVVVANHSSLYDIPALMGAVPGIAIMGREYLTRIPGFGRLLTALHYIAVDTESPRKAHASLERAAEVARAGVSVGIFPEGTRTPDGEVKSLRRGFVRVLRKSGLDLVPARITGTFALKPKGRTTMDPRERICVRLGAPVRNAELTGLSDREIVRQVHALLQSGEGGRDAAL